MERVRYLVVTDETPRIVPETFSNGVVPYGITYVNYGLDVQLLQKDLVTGEDGASPMDRRQEASTIGGCVVTARWWSQPVAAEGSIPQKGFGVNSGDRLWIHLPSSSVDSAEQLRCRDRRR